MVKGSGQWWIYFGWWWVVVGPFWIVVGGGGFILVVVEVDGIFRVVVGDGEYFLGGSECWWVVVDGGG